MIRGDITRWTIGLALLALSVGCSHTWFQFDVSQNELNWIANAQGALAASAGNPNALAQVVDLQGRRGAETLIAGMTVESTEADRQYDQLAHALYLGLIGDLDDPAAALSSDTNMMAARVAQRVAASGLNQMGLGMIGNLVGQFADNDGQRLNEMSASLARGQIGTCREGDVIVSYNAGILGHIHTDLADNDPTYQAWRDRVRAIHLVRFTCATGHVLVVMTRNRDEQGLRVIGWHFMTPQQWQSLEPQLRQAFDLPS
ncbi:MAG: hypothetical protein AB7S26_05770 [Sandaracinaceae bacterium]